MWATWWRGWSWGGRLCARTSGNGHAAWPFADVRAQCRPPDDQPGHPLGQRQGNSRGHPGRHRSEEHTSELQSHLNLVCRLLLEKKKKQKTKLNTHMHLRHWQVLLSYSLKRHQPWSHTDNV